MLGFPVPETTLHILLGTYMLKCWTCGNIKKPRSKFELTGKIEAHPLGLVPWNVRLPTLMRSPVEDTVAAAAVVAADAAFEANALDGHFVETLPADDGAARKPR